MRRLLAAAVMALCGCLPVAAQEPGWQFSPLPGEGDRAALGCTTDTTALAYTCLVVRCEDDFSVALHLYTSRHGGPSGRWELTFDRQNFAVTAVSDASPYGGQLQGDIAGIIEGIEQGETGYIQPLDGASGNSSRLPLSGSLHKIRQALYFCAPRVDAGQPTPADLVAPVPATRPQAER